MLVIRREQRAALEDGVKETFVKKLLLHFSEFYSRHWTILGRVTMEKTIRHGIEEAAACGVTSQREVCYYLSMMFLFGSGFVRDPQLPWAAAMLEDPSINEHPDRVELAYQRGLEYLEKVAGPENILVRKALKRVAGLSYGDLPSALEAGFQTSLYSMLEEVYPEKWQELEEQCKMQLLEQGRKGVAGMSGEGRAPALIVLMMFFLGSGFAEDPQLPWLEAILDADAPGSSEQRAKALFDEAKSQLKNWVE